MRKILILLGLISSLATLSGCSLDLFTVYKIDVQQGNALSEQDVARVREGMTPRQVAFLLGHPMLQDPFHKDRWDYIYYFKPGYGDPVRARLTLKFVDGKVAEIRKEGTFVDPDLQYLERNRDVRRR